MSELEAGRELDELIAVKVMGDPMPPIPTGNRSFDRAFHGSITGDCETSNGGAWALATSGYDSGDLIMWYPKPYSTSIAAAWEVVEKLRLAVSPREGGGWVVEWARYRWVVADTAPLAICRAALKAVNAI